MDKPIKKQTFMRLKDHFGVSYTSLAVFRMSLGFIALWNALSYITDAQAFLTDKGFLPRMAFLRYAGQRTSFCLNMISGETWVQVALLCLMAISAACLLLGYKTRISALVTWFFLASIQNRNPFITTGGDTLLRLMCMWCIFAPVSRKFSLDSQTNQQPVIENSELSASALAPQIQIALMYLATAILKSGLAWHNGTALYMALSIDAMCYEWVSSALLKHPEFIKFLTHATLILEYLAPLLLLFPQRLWFVRIVGFTALAMLHIGIFITIRLGFFSLLDIICLIPFLPQQLWTYLNRFSIRGIGPRVARFYNNLYLKYFNKRNPSSVRRSAVESTKPINYVALILLSLTLWINLNTINCAPNLPKFIRGLTSFIRINQKWKMYAPRPTSMDGWYVIYAELSDGQKYDLMRHSYKIDWNKPKNLALTFKSFRWRKYYLNLAAKKKNHGLIREHALYLYKKYRKSPYLGGKKIKNIKIYFMLERTPPIGQEAIVKKRLMIEYKPPAKKPQKKTASEA